MWEKAGVQVFEKGLINPVKIAKESINFALKQGLDTIIIDTAGRLHIDDALMKELEEIKKQSIQRNSLTVDAMIGQDAVKPVTANEFNKRLEISGVILTKLDGDTRGGAALSIKAITGKPIKFSGIGEKIGDIEPFYPDRIASRILGMGDVLTLIEKAQEAVSEEEAKMLEEKFRKNNFNFEDYLIQMENLNKMGNINDLIGMIPGLSSKMKNIPQVDEKKLNRQKQ